MRQLRVRMVRKSEAQTGELVLPRKMKCTLAFSLREISKTNNIQNLLKNNNITYLILKITWPGVNNNIFSIRIITISSSSPNCYIACLLKSNHNSLNLIYL